MKLSTAFLVALIFGFPAFAEEGDDSGEMRLLTPFEPKPIGIVPEGWEIVVDESAEEVEHVVTLKDGSKQTIGLKPFLLRPVADGQEHFAVKDPAFRAQDGYEQPVLEHVMVKQDAVLKETELELEQALSRLHELLLTLPDSKTNPQTATQP